jgi:hypothetical protein
MIDLKKHNKIRQSLKLFIAWLAWKFMGRSLGDYD